MIHLLHDAFEIQGGVITPLDEEVRGLVLLEGLDDASGVFHDLRILLS